MLEKTKDYMIKLSTIDSVKRFVTKCTMYNFYIDAKSEHYVVNAKSLMGLFSLNLSNPIMVCLHTENSDDIKDFEGEFCDLILDK